MARVFVQDTELQDIANAIREKNGTETTYKPSEMGNAVRGIQSGGSGEEFVGIKFSGDWNYRNQPTIADASALPEDKELFGGYFSLFKNNNANANGGFYVALKTVYLPKMRTFPIDIFYYCRDLKNIYGDFTNVYKVSTNAFFGCSSLTDLPYMENVEVLENNCFAKCTALSRFPYLPKLYKINKDIITETAITDVKIYNTIDSFDSVAFRNSNVIDIYVPWSEGEVNNAPWGATNATIHYNTVYDENNNPIV